MRTARVAAILYLSMFPFALFSLYVRLKLFVPGDAATTANNIVASEGLVRTSIVSWLVGQTIFVFLLLALYKLLRPVNNNHALLMVILALLGVPIAFLNELNQLAALLLLSGADQFAAFEAGQARAQVMLFLGLHDQGVYIAQIFWGLWLFPLGYLVFKSGFLPRILGVLLMIGCFGYLLDSVAAILFPEADVTISQFTFVGEVLLPLWLLIKGVNVEQWDKRALESV